MSEHGVTGIIAGATGVDYGFPVVECKSCGKRAPMDERQGHILDHYLKFYARWQYPGDWGSYEGMPLCPECLKKWEEIWDKFWNQGHKPPDRL